MIPAALQIAPRWVVWQYESRDGRRTKILYDPRTGRRASSTDPETWTTYEEAARVREYYAGIGFVLGDGWIGIDWDHVRDGTTGTWACGVLEEIHSLETYAEISPSGTGAHAILLGDALPGERCRAGDGPEFYASGRFFTVTGDHIDGTPEEVRTPPPGALETMYRRHIPAEAERAQAPTPAPAAALDDDEIIRRATGARNGEAFSRLFNGDWGRYPSQSEADAALCSHIAFWTQDAGQIDRIFRRSGLYREKWNREDYRNLTIGGAIARTQDRYTPGRRTPPTTPPTGINGLFEVDPKSRRISLKFARIADHIKAIQPMISFQQKLWVYVGDRYEEDRGQIEALIQQTARTIGYDDAISPVKREVLSYLRDSDGFSEYPFDQGEGYLPVRNGVLHITADDARLLPHGPEHQFTFCLPVAYDPAASAQFVAETFTDWVGEDAGYLVQVPAQCILQMWGRIYKAAYLFEGQTNAGKTTYCDLLYAFFGEQTFSKVGLYDLLTNRFAVADLLGRMLNVQDDLPFIPLKSMGTFKDLTGGVKHRIERKHENGFKATIRAVHLFTCNRPPEIKDMNDWAFWGRWVYLMFSNAYPVNPEFQRHLTSAENLSGFLNLVIAKIQAVLRGDDHIRRMTPGEVRDVWTAGSSPVVSFIAKTCTRDAHAEIPKDLVYEAYARHCQTEAIPCVPKNTFSGELARLGIIGCRSREGGRRIQAYRGIRWNDNAPDRLSPSGQGSQGDSQLSTPLDQTTIVSGQGGQGIFTFIAREREGITRTKKFGVINPDHPDQDNEPREAATHSTDPTDYQTLPRPDFGQHCAACGKQGVLHREKPADFNRRRGTAALCADCFDRLGGGAPLCGSTDEESHGEVHA